MTHRCKRLGLVAWIITVILALSPAQSFALPHQTEWVLVGSGHKNVCLFVLDLASGALTPTGDIAQVDAPTFLATWPNRWNLFYAITEGRRKEDSFVSAFRIDSVKSLTFLNRQPAGGTGPCYVAVDQSGGNVLVANYNRGSVSVFPVDKRGALGPMSAFIQDHGSSINPRRQEGPHAHCIVTDRDDRFAFACDLGLDKVMVYKFDPSKGSLVANDPPFASVKPGAGPRHIVFHPNRRHAYVINELASTLTAFAYDRHKGVLSEIEEYPLLPKDFKGQNTAAEVAVHPSGKFVYASNRGDDSIVVFGCDTDTGRLNFIERDSSEGKTPRNFEIDPPGAFLLAANQDSGTVVVFRIDTKTGRLQPTGNKAVADMPMCVKCLGLTRNFEGQQ
jgi:6-phosphogluconolactonase